MKILIDTNIIIDVLEHRDPFFDDSYRVIQLGLQGKLKTFMSAGSATDVYYIISRSIGDAGKAREKIIALTTLIKIVDTTARNITVGLSFKMNDFEDAVIAAIAKREKADFIITRNTTDFTGSPVPAISARQLLDRL